MSDLVDSVLDVPAFFDPIDRIEGAVLTFYYANWKRARKFGPLGFAFEFLASVVGYSAPTVLVERGAWRGIDIERLLMRHGIKIWDRGIASKTSLYFCVKRRQVAWAEYLLERAGVPLLSQHDPKARTYGQRARDKGLANEPPFKRAVSWWDSIRTELITFAIGATGLLIVMVFVYWMWLR